MNYNADLRTILTFNHLINNTYNRKSSLSAYYTASTTLNVLDVLTEFSPQNMNIITILEVKNKWHREVK